MFGHQNNSHSDTNQPAPEPEPTVVSPTDTPDETADAAADGTSQADNWQHPGIPADDDMPASSSNLTTGADPDDTAPEPESAETPTAPEAATDAPADLDNEAVAGPAAAEEPEKAEGAATEEPTSGGTPVFDVTGPAGNFNPPATPADDTATHELIDIKQKALNELSPLVNQLDQTPEDRFRTLMMVIQSSDDQSLLKDAYAAAEKIQDDKLRAQALLDVVNEINYFTQPHHDA